MKRSRIVALLVFLVAAALAALLIYLHPKSRAAFPEKLTLSSGWQLQDAAKVPQQGADLSQPGFQPGGWLAATVPGTVLTTLVDNKVYPEPLYGENNRPDKIPESLCRTSYWYRTVLKVPPAYEGRKIWLNFDGINYAAEVWVNGKNAGSIRGAFARGIFDVTGLVTPGRDTAVAVLVAPQPHPGDPIEHTVANGLGKNGGITAIDGPTFLCSIGWDWIPGIRDRNTGIWQKVFLDATGPVLIKEPLVTTDLPLPSLDTADISVQATLENTSDQPAKGFLDGKIGAVSFRQPVELAAHASTVVSLDPKAVPALRFAHPRLWWPNGYGPQNLYTLQLSFAADGGAVSDRRDVSFGIRKVAYSVPDSENLTLSVNGVRVFCKGGDWGMDDAMKRIPRARLEAQIRMHQLANLNMIRNWVGQSTSEDFYELCDQYGIMLWDEFFQPNPHDGPNPTDLATYTANVREKIVRFRNHPSIVVWCGRNEGRPPKEINDAIADLMKTLEPTRLYQPSSTDGRGVHSGGPYRWRTPRDFYKASEPFKTEIGSVSIPTLESIHGMMPEKDWETVNDDWAEHDLARGAQGGDSYPRTLGQRYGPVANLADFARKGQLATYEAFRAMYEGREAKLFNPCTAVITWMSHPAQPSFVWQLYHYDLEPNAALFAVQKACEPVHIQLNEGDGTTVQVIDHRAEPLTKARAHLAVYGPDGSKTAEHDFAVEAAPTAATTLEGMTLPPASTPVSFVQLQLRDEQGKALSENFYWRGASEHPDDLHALEDLPPVELHATASRHDADGRCRLEVTLENPSDHVALMAHLQLRRQASGERVLPVYCSQNYLSFVPHETKTLTVEAAQADLRGEKPLLVLDGWNVTAAPFASAGVDVATNKGAQVASWPTGGFRSLADLRPLVDMVKIDCGGEAAGDFIADTGFDGGSKLSTKEGQIDVSAPNAAPAEVYRSERYDACAYAIPLKPGPPGRTYLVRLHFAETKFDQAGQRKFHVEINGQRVLADFDIFAEAGAKGKAVVKDFPGVVPDGKGGIVVRLVNGSVEKAKINGIEILPVDAPH